MLTDCVTRRRLTRREPSTAIAWPTGSARLYWELDSTEFDSGTVIVTIEVSFDSGATWAQTKRTAFDWNAERGLKGQAPGPIAGWHGPFVFGPGRHPRGERISDPRGVVVNPTHFKIAVAPLAGNPRVGARVQL